MNPQHEREYWDEAHGRETRVRRRLLEAAMAALAGAAPVEGLLARAAASAGCDAERARIFFARDADLVHALYFRLAADLETRVPEFPDATVAERFHAAMDAKLDLVTPYRAVLGGLLRLLVNPRDEIGVLSAQSELVRLRVSAVMIAVVDGASDRPARGADALARSLYSAHLALMLLWSQDQTPGASITRAAIDKTCAILTRSAPLFARADAQALLAGADRIFSRVIEPDPEGKSARIARDCLRVVFQYRRLLPGQGDVGDEGIAAHLPRARRAVAAGEPLHLVLPAFPAKSPSPRKVLGVLPDMAEEIALKFLGSLCEEIKAIHPPGARITICSDGHVFSELVGVPDDTITDYGAEISRMIERFGLGSLDTFSMADVFDGDDFETMRARLIQYYAEPRETIVDRIKRHPSQRTQFNGIHRFLFEDRAGAEPERSRTQVRNEAKERAYDVIQRSEAWGRLISECFPASLRLSIHPQPALSDKIGILFGPARDAWLTPWHGCAVLQDGKYSLMPREAGEELGATVAERDGRPYAMEVLDSDAG